MLIVNNSISPLLSGFYPQVLYYQEYTRGYTLSPLFSGICQNGTAFISSTQTQIPAIILNNTYSTFAAFSFAAFAASIFSSSSWAWWRTSAPLTQKMTSSAML